MNLDLRTARAALLGIAVVWPMMQHVDAAPVSVWRTFKSSPATTIAGQGTSSPVIGATGPSGSAATSRIIGYFTPQTLASVGDKISLTFTVSFNDATGMSNGGDNFRYALFDTNGEATPLTENIVGNGTTDTNAFVGYWAGVMTGTGTDGSIRERFDTANNDMFANATGTLYPAAINGTDVPLTGLIEGVGISTPYAGELTIGRTATGITLSGGFSGNGGANTFSVTEESPISLTYGAVGFLNGSGISADQLIFQNVDVTYTAIPEPSSLALAELVGVLGTLALCPRQN